MKKLVIVIVVLIIVALWISFCGYVWSWGPFRKLHNLKTRGLRGNAEEYDLEYAGVNESSKLSGKTVVFLGSSVTYGASSCGVSFADYLSRRNSFTMVKEAVSGTTLADTGADSYVSRLQKIDADHVDLLICQLSTNDASQKKPLGIITEDRGVNDFDTKTVAGAIEFIVSFTTERWNCPVVFYTNSKYDSKRYGEMVELLHELSLKWGVQIIDLWNDSVFNQITDDERKLYMADSIHPTKAGYLRWWVPFFEKSEAFH